MGYYITENNEYYEGDRRCYTKVVGKQNTKINGNQVLIDQVETFFDQIVPKRPSQNHIWNGVEWVLDEQKTKEAHNAQILSEIEKIECKNLRALRDAILRNDISYIQAQDNQITALRLQLIKE